MHIAQSLLALGALFGQIASGLPAGGSSVDTANAAAIQWPQVRSALKKGNGNMAKTLLSPAKLAGVTPQEALMAFKLVAPMKGPFKKDLMLYLGQKLPLERILPESIPIRSEDSVSLAKTFEGFIGQTRARSLALTESVLKPSSAKGAMYLFLYLLDIQDYANFATLYDAIAAKKQGWSPAQQEAIDRMLETVRQAAEKKGDSKALFVLDGPAQISELTTPLEEVLEEAAVVEETKAPSTSWYKFFRNRLPSWPYSSSAAKKPIIAAVEEQFAAVEEKVAEVDLAAAAQAVEHDWVDVALDMAHSVHTPPV
jgi:hypothetical protein